nr:hypothetical protein [Tanacetum cinerariifolium]
MSSCYEFNCYGCGRPSDTPVCYLCTCEQCGNILSYGTCLNCNLGTQNSFTYDLIPESFDEVQIIPDPPPQCHFNIYLCQICESNSHYGYECSQRVSLVYEPELCYIQNFSDNDYSHDLPGVNPLIDHHCCYKCGNSLNDFFCYECTSEFCGNGAHVGYNCPAQVPSFQTLPKSFDESQIIPDPPPQCHFNIFLCQICGSNSHYGYECSQRVPLVYEPKPCYIQNFSDNDYSHDLPAQVPSFQTLPSFPQQYPCEDCGVLSEADHCQPPQYTANHPIFNVYNDILNSQTKLMEQVTSMCAMFGQFIQKKHEEEQAANARYWKIPACCDDDDDYNFAITPNEPVDSLSMRDEHLNTILATESDKFIKSSVKNLVSNPSESEGENGCDVPACFTTFSNILFNADYEFDSSDDQSLYDEDVPEKMFSNPLFEEESIPVKIDQHHDNVESDLVESLRTHDSSLIISSKIDSLLDEFAGELTLLKSIPPGIDETDCDPDEDIRLIERLLYDNSSPCPPKEFVSENSNANIESFSPSPILVKDSDSFIEEIDLSCTPDDPMPPGIEEDDYESERNILISEELLNNYFLSLPVIESYHFDIPSFFRPPAKPPDDFPEEIFSNPLFEEEIISTKIDPHHFDAESDLIESMLNHDSSIIPSSLKIDSFLDEFADELTLLKSISLGIDKTDCYPEGEIRLTKRLLYDNSSPRPPEEFVSENSNAEIKSFSPSPIPVEDSDSFMEEIDLSCTPDDSMPPGIEDDDYDSKRDILILKELLDNDSLSFPVIESYHFDIPLFSRPPAKPPDGNTGILNIKMMDDNSEQKVKDKQEKDKIGTKPDKNEKRGKARQCQISVTIKKAEKAKKIRTQVTKTGKP